MPSSLVCRDRDGAVKSAAAEALGKIGDPKADSGVDQALPGFVEERCEKQPGPRSSLSASRPSIR